MVPLDIYKFVLLPLFSSMEEEVPHVLLGAMASTLEREWSSRKYAKSN